MRVVAALTIQIGRLFQTAAPEIAVTAAAVARLPLA
jgi:hypothetical protein